MIRNDVILIVGFGSIGRQHAAVLHEHFPGINICILRRPESSTDAEGILFGADVVTSLDDALRRSPSAAVICGPAPTHLPIAMQLAAEGVHLLVEKPLSHDLSEVDALIRLCDKNNLVLQVGYCLRFDDGLTMLQAAVTSGAIGRPMMLRAEIGQYLPDWRKGQDYRTTVSASAQTGGGALLELSHEIDYVEWLFGPVREISARTGRLGDLDIDTEDCAEMILSCAENRLASVHMDFLQRRASRICKVVGTEGAATWNATAGEFTLDRVDDDAPVCHVVDNGAPARLRRQMEHFLGCIETGATPLVDGRQGRRVLEIIAAARESTSQGKTIPL